MRQGLTDILIMFTNWKRGSYGFWPTSISTHIKCNWAYSVFLQPFAKEFCDTIYCYMSVKTTITLLFFASRPFAVFRRIRAVIVDSINGKIIFVGITHIFEKCLKRISPSLANINTSTTIIFVTGFSRIMASLLHIVPYIIDSCSCETVCFRHNWFLKKGLLLQKHCII